MGIFHHDNQYWRGRELLQTFEQSMANVPKRQQEPEGDFVGGGSQLVREVVVLLHCWGGECCSAATNSLENIPLYY
jgi:rhodanese-related sulfurtransferase